jgi:hypothetical protein
MVLFQSNSQDRQDSRRFADQSVKNLPRGLRRG